MFPLHIDNKVAWITGGSRGIGKAAAIALAKAGCQVIIGYHTQKDNAEQLAKDLRAEGYSALALHVDVRERASCEACFARIKEQYPRVDILVNSAGIIADNLFLSLEDEEWENVLRTNLMGVVHTSKLVLQDMLRERFGRIIHLSSAAGQKGGRGQANYAASKAAVEGLTRSLASEVGKRGITVNCLAPGVVETDMSRGIIKLAKDEILSRQLMQRFAAPEEIAAWVVFLASDYGGFITGQTIAIDGGLRMA